MHSPDKHLIDEYAKRPPVDRLVVSFALNYLRRKVLGSSAQRPCTAQYSTLQDVSSCWSRLVITNESYTNSITVVKDS